MSPPKESREKAPHIDGPALVSDGSPANALDERGGITVGDMKRALPESEPSSGHFVHTLPVAACTCDNQGRVIHYNRAALTLWGRAPHATKDMWCGSWRFYNTDGTPFPIEQCPLSLAIRKSRPIDDCEFVIERPDGSRRHLLCYLEPLLDTNRTASGALIMFIDVTNHERRQTEGRQSESDLRDFVETANIGLHWVGADGRILWANQAELAMLGYTREEYIGHHIAEFHADKAIIENILACLTQGEKIRDQAARLRCKDGSIRHVLINSSVLFKNGEFVHTRCFTHDITERKHIEEQRVQLLAREWAAREEAETLLEMSREFLTELDLHKLLKTVTDTSRELTKAQFSMFVYKTANDAVGTAIHYAVSGAPHEIFPDLRDVRYAALVEPIFRDAKVLRVSDVLSSGKFKEASLPFGLLGKYLPLRSYLEVPVVSRGGEILGRLFVGHPEPDVFSERAERISKGIAAQAAIALDNERLLKQRELREQRFREMIDALPAAIYTTDAEGKLTHYNQAAITFSGQIPQLGSDQWCVSWKLYRSDGSALPHDECPMAIALKEGRLIRGVEAIAERPDGTRRWFMPYPTPLRNANGIIVGGINMLVDITERKQLESAIGHLAAIVASSDDAILSKDLSGIIQSWNNSAQRLYGYRSEEMIGQSVYRFIPLNRHEEESFILDRIAQGQRIDHYETVRLHKDGRRIAVSLTVSPIFDQQGHPIGASTIARDITQDRSKQRQQQCLYELATSVNQSDALSEVYSKSLDAIIRALEADRAAILLYDEDGIMRFKASRGLSELYQRAVEGHSPWSKDEPSPAPIVIPNIEAADIESQLKAVVLGEGIQALAFIPLTYGRQLIGKFMVYFDAPHPLGNQELELAQTLAHTLASGIERKRADESLRQELTDTKLLQEISTALIEENNVQTLYERLLDAAMRIMRSDMASMQIVDEQEDALQMLACRGFEPNFGDIFTVDHPDTKTSCSLARQQKQRVIMPDVEMCDLIVGTPALEAHRKTGIRAVQSTPLISRSGNVMGMMNTYWRVPHHPTERDLNLFDVLARQAADLLERRHAEEAVRQSELQLRAFTEELEQLVTNRTEELVQSQSRLRALATEMNLLEQRERQRIATELHDHLQQLLVLGKIKLGQGRRVVDTAPACVDLMKQVDDVLSDALKYTRTLVAELSPPVLRDHGLPAALKWLVEQMRHHDLTVSLELPIEDLHLPDNHAVLLFQSVRELLINSAKHAGIGHAAVRVSEAERVLSIEVQDHGKGFDHLAPAETAQIGTMSSKFGLFSIRERMKALGGSFELESTPGLGTTATLILPMRNYETEPPKASLEQTWATMPLPQVDSAGRSQQKDSQPTKRIHVLLADDHAMVRQGLRAVLEAYNDVHIIGEAKNGEEAVVLVDKLQPSVVVMDINMPKLNGIDATIVIKSRHPQVRVIGLSVNASSSNHDAMKQAGADTLLTKETAVDELYRAIQETLKGALPH